MSRDHAAWIHDLASHIARAEDLPTLRGLLLEDLRGKLALSHVSFGLVRTPRGQSISWVREEEGPDGFSQYFMSTYESTDWWQRFYADLIGDLYDPVVERGLSSRHPFDWKSVTRAEWEWMHSGILGMSDVHDIDYGASFPVHDDVHGAVGQLAITPRGARYHRELELDDDEIRELNRLAFFVHRRFLELLGACRSHLVVKPRGKGLTFDVDRVGNLVPLHRDKAPKE